MTEEQPKTDWSIPRKTDSIIRAFPAGIIGEYLPPLDEIPAEFLRQQHHNPWCKQASSWFFRGVDKEASTVICKPHIDTPEKANDALWQIQTCLRSFEPKHEHKIGGVGYLMSLFFEELDLVALTEVDSVQLPGKPKKDSPS